MNDLRNYLKILEDMTDLLSNLPESCESYCDDIIYLIDKQYDKMYCKLEKMELDCKLKNRKVKKYGKRNGTNL